MRKLAVLTLMLSAMVCRAAGPPDGNMKGAAGKPAGVKTPGVQIPMAKLKPETEFAFPGKAEWLAFSEALFVPDAAKESIAKVDAKTGALSEPMAGVTKPCAGVVSAFGSLWAGSCADGGALLRFDAKTMKKTAEIRDGLAEVAGAMAASSDSLWVIADGKTTLARIDPEQNAVVAEVRLPAGCRGLAFGESALWAACPEQDKVLKIDPATNLISKRIAVSGAPESLVIGEGSVWALCTKEGKLDRIDPKTDKVTKSIELGTPGLSGQMVFGEGAIWLTMPGFPLTRVSPTSETVVQQFYGAGGGAIRTSPGFVWLANPADSTVWKIDPRRVAATLAE